MLALMHVLLTRDLVDLNLCHRLAYGVDTFIDYVLGHNDGQPKTPLWAEGITHIAAADIEALALELSREKPCFVLDGDLKERVSANSSISWPSPWPYF